MKKLLFSASLLACLLPAAGALAADRVVTLGASVTETVFALGAGDLVVARDLSSVYPKAATQLPDVGYFRTIGAEGVLAQKPTLILAAYGIGPEDQVTLLKNSGVRFIQVEAMPSLASTPEMISKIGKLLHREKEANGLIDRIKARFAAADSLAKTNSKRPKVVVLMGMGAGVLEAAYDGTAASELVALAGGSNPFSGYKGYKTTGAEQLYASDPDFIFIASRDGQAAGNAFAPPKSAPEWLQKIRAAQSGRLLTFDMTYFLVFGPRIGDAVYALAQTLHAPPAIARAAR